jgi:hypothetical protein
MDLCPDDTKASAAPRFCPRCRVEERGAALLCRECGERLIPEGYCGICEAFWRLPEGSACPKHDLPLDAWRPFPAEALDADGQLRWTTVAIFPDTLKAEAPRIRLEAEGIPTFLEGERMGSRSMYQVATGGVKLQVPEPLVPEARILLSQSWTPPPLDDDLEDAWDDLAPEPGALRRSVMKGVIVFLLLAPLLMTLLARCFKP